MKPSNMYTNTSHVSNLPIWTSCWDLFLFRLHELAHQGLCGTICLMMFGQYGASSDLAGGQIHASIAGFCAGGTGAGDCADQVPVWAHGEWPASKDTRGGADRNAARALAFHVRVSLNGRTCGAGRWLLIVLINVDVGWSKSDLINCFPKVGRFFSDWVWANASCSRYVFLVITYLCDERVTDWFGLVASSSSDCEIIPGIRCIVPGTLIWKVMCCFVLGSVL